MKKRVLTLGTLLLCCCFAAAQATSQPSTSAAPPDAAAQASGQGGNQATSLQGCLSQSSDGNFMLADNAGNNFQLRGETSQLNNYIGKQVQVQGSTLTASGPNAGAMATPSEAQGAAKQFNVSSVSKIADSCASK